RAPPRRWHAPPSCSHLRGESSSRTHRERDLGLLAPFGTVMRAFAAAAQRESRCSRSPAVMLQMTDTSSLLALARAVFTSEGKVEETPDCRLWSRAVVQHSVSADTLQRRFTGM